MALISGAQAVHLCTAFLATTESPIPDNWKQKIIDTDSFNPELIKKVCQFDLNIPKLNDVSLAAGTVNKIISTEELVKNIIKEAENILKNLGFQEDVINFIQK